MVLRSLTPRKNDAKCSFARQFPRNSVQVETYSRLGEFVSNRSPPSLRLDVVGDLLGHDHDMMQDAVWVLGGLVSQGVDQRVALHHLLFRDYLETSVFNAREVKRWHQRLADWCADDLDSVWVDDRYPIEQTRRVYARQHYITHIALAENRTNPWQEEENREQNAHFVENKSLYNLNIGIQKLSKKNSMISHLVTVDSL